MMSSKTLRMRERDIFRIYQVSLESLDKHADPNTGEMVLPTTMTQDDRSRIKIVLKHEHHARRFGMDTLIACFKAYTHNG